MVSKEKVAMLCDVVSDEEIKNIFWSSWLWSIYLGTCQ